MTANTPAYLDYAATAPLRPAARAAWLAAVDEGPANPASLHSAGRRASHRLEQAREAIATLAGVTPSEVLFTSGGTESTAIALQGLFRASRGRRVLVGATEHKAVLDTAAALPGAEVVRLPVDTAGRLLIGELEQSLTPDTALVAVMAANNEVGTVNDLVPIRELCRSAGVPLHVDAVQVPATRDIPAGDTVALSAHKVGGPVGVGALLVRRGLELPVHSHGGGQEGGIRSGTVNVAGASAFAAAAIEARERRAEEVPRIAGLRDELQRRILAAVPGAVVNAADADRLASHLHVTFPGCEADALLMLLDGAGVAVSTGSACTVGIPQPSHVLLAMGATPAAARGSLRFSLGWASGPAEVEAAADAIGPAVARARRASLAGAS